MGKQYKLSTHTLYSGWKLNKTPLALAGHVEGWKLVNSERSSPRTRGKGSAELGWSSRAQDRCRGSSLESILCFSGL